MEIDIGGYRFLSAQLLLLAPVLLLIASVFRFNGRREINFNPFLILEPLKHPLFSLMPAQGKSRGRSYFDQMTFWTTLLLMVVALGQPVKVGEKKQDQYEQRDIAFVIDTSLSMILKDYDYLGQRVSRIAILKQLLLKFIDELKDDRISVVVFGESAHTMSPYTQDKTFLKKVLTRIDAGMVGRYNALGEGIALAAQSSEKSSDIHKNRKQVLLLFTDAGQNTSSIDPEAAAFYAKELGYAMYIIAIGAGNAEAGEDTPYGRLIYQPVDLNYLEQLAKITDGKSYSAENSEAINTAIADILRVQTNPAILPPQFNYIPLFHIPLAIAVLWLVIYTLLGLIWRWRQ